MPPRSLPPLRLLLPLLVAAGIFCTPTLYAQLALSSLLSDGAVLQREQPIPVWGRAAARSEVRVALGAEQQQVRAGRDGTWRVVFAPRNAGESTSLSVQSGTSQLQIKNLLLGDVWICSGQSNMEWPLRETANAQKEIASSSNSQVRLFKVPLDWSSQPAPELDKARWESAGPRTAGDFSAVAYYFAKQVHANTGIPIGLISTNWGGSNIEAWMSPYALGKTSETTRRNILSLVANADKKRATIEKRLARWTGSLVESSSRSTEKWQGFDLDTRTWLPLNAPGLWETQGFAGMDGVAWYRKTFQLSAGEALGDLELGLGRIDDTDTTWVNGHLVGKSNAYDQLRTYSVPSKFLRSGANRIAIRVEDTGGGGGIYSDPTKLYVELHTGKKRTLVGPWKFRPEKVTLQRALAMNHVPTALYNKMLFPLYETPVKGVLWYQGESNAGTALQATRYAEQFQKLIRQWRTGWKRPDLPFYWVQLASFDSGTNTAQTRPWALLRQSQSSALQLPHTGQAITLDIGSAESIHPRNKKDVGDRLARIALHETYAKSKVHFRGPTFASLAREKGKVVVQFHSVKSLQIRGSGSLVGGFEWVAPSGETTMASARIVKNTVEIPWNGSNAVALQYAWTDNPEQANLQDAEGLPVEPFQVKLGL